LSRGFVKSRLNETLFAARFERKHPVPVTTRMKSARVFVPWKAGLHLRPAAQLVRLAQSFRSTIFLKCGDKLADARSIMSILLLTASLGAVVDVEVSGEDEANAATAIAQIFSTDDDGAASEQRKPD
jgi:phosphotransferase system HPr (HPr) family protein